MAKKVRKAHKGNDVNPHQEPFSSREDMRNYILARAETRVGREAMDTSVLATKLVAAATFA